LAVPRSTATSEARAENRLMVAPAKVGWRH
jgi:hypothetical protein